MWSGRLEGRGQTAKDQKDVHERVCGLLKLGLKLGRALSRRRVTAEAANSSCNEKISVRIPAGPVLTDACEVAGGTPITEERAYEQDRCVQRRMGRLACRLRAIIIVTKGFSVRTRQQARRV